MNKSYLIAVVALLAGCVTAQTEKDYTVSANATLKDGSTVKGEFCTEQISGSTVFLEKLKLDPSIVKSLAFSGTNGESKVELTNGDKFAMTVANDSFAIKSLLGELRGCRSLRYEDLFPASNFRDWHHYAIIWDKDGISDLTGSPRMALLLDGHPVPDIQNHIRSTEDASAIISTPTLLSFTHDPKLDPEFSTKSPFLIDEFKIWNYAKTDFSL